MNATTEYHIKPSTSVSSLSLNSECQIVTRLIKDSIIVSSNLLGNWLPISIPNSNEMLLLLSDRDRDLFLNALEYPLKPNEYLQDAFAGYHQKKHKDA